LSLPLCVFVTGEVRPPANPLVMAQPCFRFNDLDNIGITQRHYSGFVMLGQHNFISSKTGASVLTLPVSVEGVKEVKDYFDLFDYIIDNLISTFTKQGINPK